MDEMKALSTFVRVVEAGSFRRAAIEQGVTPQAASKLVKQLEVSLGVRLLHRTTRQLSLTDEGQQLLQQARTGLDTLRTAIDGVKASRADKGGTVRVTAPRSTRATLVLPLVAAFLAEHPDTRVDLTLDDQFTDLVAGKIDVGFRSGATLDRNLVARRLMDIQLLVCASPAYLARHGHPRTWDDLARHTCTGFRHAQTGKQMPWEYLDGDATAYRDVPAAFVTNDVDAEVQAVLSGIGIGQLPSYLAQPLIREGQLVHLLTRHTSARVGLFLYYPQRSHQPARVRAFIDFAAARLR
ncbi:LysR family transcriptional regulator [Rhizobacter sp. Root1221]|uniref:LysR family transcriptional regulator n=1 Tax=Rhizobacter sp. Root1221 TaxID=1736433 RepID=UPI0006F7042F|nr:LysR family transcriptional regulator [Rhizobacter sp. Root1221]KQW02632.1 hypothetical protein ASC87_13065 [Rhizobacter sp. Root1221]